MLMLAEEVSSINAKIARLIAKSAVTERETQKSKRADSVKSLPDDVRTVLAQLGTKAEEVESVFDKDGNAIYARGLDDAVQ